MEVQHRQRAPGGRRGAALAVLALALAAPAVGWSADAEARACPSGRCLVVEHEPALAREAAAVVEALSLRLSAYDIAVFRGGERGEREPGASADAADEGRLLWVVHLRSVSADYVLVAVDNLGSGGQDDVVREIRRGKDSDATAWTMALMIEETVLPYLDGSASDTPLGAGLAIIEPPEVGGSPAGKRPAERPYPRLRFLELGLSACAFPVSTDVVAGPRFKIEGAIAARVTAALAVGWAGWGDFSSGGVAGTNSVVPLDVEVGYVFLPERIVELSGAAGFSVGFSVYRTERDDERRTDAVFDPWFQLSLRAIFRAFDPWAVFVDGGASFVLLRDELLDSRERVYLQDWVVPRLAIGFQLWL